MFSFLLSFALIIGAVIVYALLIAPIYNDIQKARGTLVSETRNYDEQKDVFDKINVLNEKYKGNGTLQDAISLALPNEPFISQIVGNVASIANLNNHMPILSAQTEVLPLRASAAWPAYIKNIGTVKFVFQLKGNYADFKKFISKIENNYRIFDVKQLSVKADQTANGQSNVYVYGLTLNAYYQDITKLGDRPAAKK